MYLDFNVASTDGFGDRDDIALERDRQAGVMIENKQEEIARRDEAISRSREYGTASSAKKLSAIIQGMIEKEVPEMLLTKSEVIWDVESIHDAVTEACIQIGLDDELFAPNIHDQGYEINIRLY